MKLCLDKRWHAPFWLGGVVLGIFPFVLGTFFDGPRAPWVEGPGYFGVNLIRSIWWGLGGACLGGLAWLKLSGRTMRGSVQRWLGEKHEFQWFWYFLSVGVFGIHSYFSLDGYHFTTLEKVSTMVGRVLTGGIVVAGYWLACGLAAGLGPNRLRNWPWAVAAILPLAFLIDLMAIRFWKNSTISLLNQLDEGGTVELQVNLASGGVNVSSWILIVGLAALIWMGHRTFQWLGGLSWASGFRMQRWTAVFSVMLFWGGVWVEKAAGTGWKSQDARRWEHNAYDLHLTRGLDPPLGVAAFRVRFCQRNYGLGTDRPSSTKTRPDIFVLMVESLRQDAIQPQHAPFLSRFRDEECQQLGDTWASSNSTPLSWYGLFHGVLPVSWPGAKAKMEESDWFETPPFLELLAKEGYRIGIHAVCDLSYRGLGSLSFGTNRGLFETYIDAPVLENSAGNYHSEIPKREQEAFKAALARVDSSSPGGNFHFIALDSTHYGYQWPADFDPPYAKFYKRSTVPAFPSPDEIQLLKKRYFNSLAWVDFQISEFVSTLKRKGRFEDSLIIVTGDHGEEFYDNGSWFHSSSLLPSQTQVPLLIKWPKGVIQPRHPSASHLDLVPSLYHYFGKSLPSEYPGVSLLEAPQSERTQMTFACNTGISGVCMAWYRDGWVATFRWENPYSHDLPGLIYLDTILRPDGKRLELSKPDEWEDLLLERFPDAPDRLFTEFGLVVEEE